MTRWGMPPPPRTGGPRPHLGDAAGCWLLHRFYTKKEQHLPQIGYPREQNRKATALLNKNLAYMYL
jgi:hypothetical protein